MRKIKRILVLLVFSTTILFLPITALAGSSVVIENPTDEDMSYSLYWIDHQLEITGPFLRAVGELDSQEKKELEYVYKSGSYFIEWYHTVGYRRERYSYIPFVIDEKTMQISITPDGVYIDNED